MNLAVTRSNLRPFSQVGIAAFLLSVAFNPPVHANDAASTRDAAAIRDCSRANLPERTSSQTVQITATDRSGGQRVLRTRLLARKNKSGLFNAMIRVEGPPDLADTRYLFLEKKKRDEMYMYLPALQKVRRVQGKAAKGNLWGTDLSYADLRQLQQVAAAGSTKQLADAELDGRTAHVLELIPTAEDLAESAYEKIISWVDQDTCVVLKSEFYDKTGLRKTLVTNPEKIARADDDEAKPQWVAHEMTMTDLRDNTHTLIEVESLRFDDKISGRYFSPRSFQTGK